MRLLIVLLVLLFVSLLFLLGCTTHIEDRCYARGLTVDKLRIDNLDGSSHETVECHSRRH